MSCYQLCTRFPGRDRRTVCSAKWTSCHVRKLKIHIQTRVWLLLKSTKHRVSRTLCLSQISRAQISTNILSNRLWVRILPHRLLIHRRQPKYGSTLPPGRFTAAPMTVLSSLPECSASYSEVFKVTYTTEKAKTMVLIELNYPNYGRLSEQSKPALTINARVL